MRVTEVRKAGWHIKCRPERANIGYDEYGQRVYIKYGNGVETNYTYDKDMRWLKHIDTANTYGKQYQNIKYTFDDVGNVKSYENDCMNGSRYRTEQTYTYDALYQLISATGTTEDNPYAIPGSPDYSSTYTQKFSFDAIGNMTQKDSKETITPAIQKKGGDDLNYEFTYQYDADYAHRLKRAGSEQKGWRYYTYDANGNVTSESDGVAPNEDTTTLTPVTVTTQTNEAGESVYEADYAWAWPWGGNGNSGKKPVPNNKHRYEWNSRNLLMRSVNSVYDTRYAYAADGNRAAKWTATNSSETLYFNTMWTWHTDTGLRDGQYSKHIYLGETRVVTKQTSKLEASYGQSDEWHHQYYYHPDHLGSAQLITDYEGNEYQRIEYTPYGELWVEKKTEKEEGLRYLPYKFTAKEQDEETGLYYYGARYLDAKYSRWMSADPAVGEYIPQAPVNDEARKHNQNLLGMGGIFNHINCNLYAYGANNPVRYIDPDGNFLINNNKNAESIALYNKRFLYNSPDMPWIQANDGKLYPAYLPFIKVQLATDLDKTIDSVKKERSNPSVFTKTMIVATCEKLDNDIYKISIVAATITQTENGPIITANDPATVAYATAYEVGITSFNTEPDQKKVNYIANQVLSYAAKGIVVDEK